MINKLNNHYTYLIMYPNGMLYHGVRSCECDVVDDEYWGSSKHTPDSSDATKLILTTHRTRKEAVVEEIRYHEDNNVKSNSRYYNLSNQKSTGFDTTGINFNLSEEAKDKLRVKKTDEHKRKISDSMLGSRNPMSGISPWENSKSTELSRELWANAVEFFDWWSNNMSKGGVAMSSALGYNKSKTTYNMILKFRSGWIPHNDENWILFHK